MKQTIFLSALILLIVQFVSAQDTGTIGLSLHQCVQLAVENNVNVKTARLDKEKSSYKKEESRSALFPRINLSGSFQDNVALMTTVIPGDFIGQPGTDVALQMGSKFNSSASLTINQIIYNRTAALALEISKKAEGLSELGVEKASEEIAAEAARLYFLILTTSEQQKLIEGNIVREERLKNIAQVMLQNGIGKQVDIDRVVVTLENYYTQLSNTQAAQQQQLNMMKYLLDLSQEQSIVLTDNADTVLLQTSPEMKSDFSDHVDIKLLESQQELNQLNQKTIRSGYLPVVSVSGLFAYQGLKSEFKDFYSGTSKSYPYSYFNVSISMPLFDGFEKRSKSRQSRMEYEKTREKLHSAMQSFSMSYTNAMNNYLNNKNNVIRQKQNLKLAEKVSGETSLKYREGLATVTNIMQDEISLSNAQSGYLTALYNFKEAEVKIMSLNGNIKDLYRK